MTPKSARPAGYMPIRPAHIDLYHIVIQSVTTHIQTISLFTLLLASLLLWTPSPASAYLSVVRQGQESRGSREQGDSHGNAITVGDFNSDGYDDMAVGAQFEDVSGYNHAGAVIVSYGSEFGIRPDGAQLLLQSDGDALEDGALFGLAVAAGDFDNDGYDDLAIGAPLTDADASHTNTGTVFVYAGGPGGLSYWHYLNQSAGGGSLESNDRFGASLAVGNLNGLAGTNEDLAIGSPGEDSNAGAVFWFTGGTQGLLNGAHGWFKQSSLGGTNVADDQFGYSLVAGQVWGSAYEELIIGTPFKEVGGTSDAGIVWVLIGTAAGPSSSSPHLISPDEGDLVLQPYPDGYFGWSLAAGRFWGGSFDGLAIGEPGRSYLGHPASGRVVVSKGSLLGLSFTSGNVVTFFQDDMGWALGDSDGFGRALAAGFYDVSDGGEDLIIGSPTDNSNGAASFSGVISVVFGGPNGPGGHGTLGWAQDAFNDDIVAFDDFGRALAVGRFDATDRGNLAVGAPGEDSNTGQVTIVAPWRQTPYAGFRNGLAVDCEGNRIYAHKPFDEVQIASTTKIMTVLIACERMGLPTSDPNYVSSNAVYQVPEWIREHIGGSLYEFEPQQRVSLFDLLYCCIFPSGNDAAYAIADMLTGGNNQWLGSYDTTCQLFVAEMNNRAAQLGMTHTHFTNPAGLDKGLPYSSAADLALLVEAAMQNQTFRMVVGSENHTFTTSSLYGGVVRVTYEDTVHYGWLEAVRTWNPLFCGAKPGRTPRAKSTAVFVASSYYGRPISVSLGNVNGASNKNAGDALMDLASGACGGSLAAGGGEGGGAAMPEVEEPFRIDFGALSTFLDDHSGGAAELPLPSSPIAQATQLGLYRRSGAGVTSCRLQLLRSAEAEIEPLGVIELGIGPFQSHGGLGFINHGETTATFSVNTSHSGTPIAFSLDPGERGTIPAYVGSEVADFTYVIQNPSPRESLALGIQEEWIWNKGSIPVGMNPYFMASLNQSDAIFEQAFRVHVTGTDPEAGKHVYVSLHDPGVTVDVATPEAAQGALASLRLLPARPNPFSSSTSIRFELAHPGAVRLEIFDPSGRRVRGFARGDAPAGTGIFSWDGKSADGNALAPGVYFYRISKDGDESANGRVTLIR